MKFNMPKMTVAQKRKREATLLEELCLYHGYSFADTLPDRDKSTMLMSRVGKKTKLELGIVVKLMVPSGGALGKQILKRRTKQREKKS